jgi:phosphoglycerol transferase MdoB-like AlkP superfamily enzyme
MGNYLHTMRYFDRAFAELNARLVETGLAERTVVALWGDHDAGLEWTAELAELAGFRHSASGWYLSQRVPFAIRVPGNVGIAGSSGVPAGHQDVAPTLLSLLGVDPAPYAFVGRNLLGNPGPGPVVGEYQCWMEDNLLFLQGDGTLTGGQCFRLPNLEPVEVTECSKGFDEAMAQIRASQMVLEHDLQQTLHHRLVN